MWTRFLMGLTALGAIGCGALFWVGPEDIAKEVPFHREVGVGFAVFGALVLLVVLSPNSGVGRRAKYLLFTLAAGAIAGLTGSSFVKDVTHGLRLEKEGRPATAVVTQRRMRVTSSARFGTHTSFASEVEYDGHRGVIDGGRGVGTRIPVLYLPSDPSVVRAGREGDGFLALAGGNGAGFWVRGGLMLVCGILVLICLPRVIFGAPANEEDPFAG